MSWGLVTPRRAVAFASWLSAQAGPVVLGADANTPLIDAPDFADTRTHWHAGDRNLHGEQGDELLFGPGKIHPLKDAFRRWLAGHPGDAERLAVSSPSGPLAVTHRTGQRKALREPRADSTASGSSATGPRGASTTSTMLASPPAAATPSSLPTWSPHQTRIGVWTLRQLLALI